MDLSLTQDEQSVREVFADLFAKESPVARVREAEPLGFDHELWAALTATGAVVMGVPEESGGGGATTVDLALVAEEYGRRVAAVPYPEAVAAVAALAQAPYDAGGELVAAVAAGDVVPTVVLRPLDGTVARLAPAGAVADVAVVLDGDELVAVRRSGPRPYAQPPRNLGSQPLADWDLGAGGQQRVVLATGEHARAIAADARSLWRVLTAAALNGVRKEALDIGVAYVKQRFAFGVPIASFQSIQHRLADVTAAGEGLDLLVHEAAWARSADPGRAPSLSTMALLAASDIAFRTAREALQFHGGYGYTLEYDIQMYFRRAKAWPLAGGALREQYQALAAELFGGANRQQSDQRAEA
jgi:alkylation response protein AidB-like acyl-CoA dehydrogenase